MGQVITIMNVNDNVVVIVMVMVLQGSVIGICGGIVSKEMKRKV